MIAVAVHAADSSLSSSEPDLPSGLVTADPEDVSAGYGATQSAMAQSPAASAASGPRLSTDNRIGSGPVVRNTPLALNTLPAPIPKVSDGSAGSTVPAANAPTVEVAQPLPRSLPGTAEDPAPMSYQAENPAAPVAPGPDRAATTVEKLTAPVTREVAQVGGLVASAGDEGTQPTKTLLSPLSRGEHPE